MSADADPNCAPRLARESLEYRTGEVKQIMIWDVAGIVVLALLKILGMVLLILLVLLLLVLFVPIRYRVSAAFYEKYEVHASISWLWFLVRTPLCWKDGQIRWKLQILGIPFLRSTKSGGHTRRKGSGKRGKQHSRQKKAEKQSILPGTKSEEDRPPKTDSVSTEENVKDGVETKTEIVLSGGDSEDDRKSERGSDAASNRQERAKNPARTGYKQAEDAQNKKKHQKHSPFRRLWQKICELYQTVCDMIGSIRRKIHSVQDFIHLLQKDSSRRFICIAKENMLQLWKHVKPQKIRGEIRFGTGDPCSTGQILGGIAVMYSWLGTGVQITPDFEEACFEGRLQGKGRIRVITMVIILIRLIRNKDFRKLQREWRQWKEDF